MEKSNETVIKELLDSEIRKTLEDIAKTSDYESEAYRSAIRKLETLHKQRMQEAEAELKVRTQQDAYFTKEEEIKLRNTELDMKVRQAEEEIKIKEAEMAIREAELKEAKRGRIWRSVLDVLGIGVPIAATSYWMYKGMKFEEEGKIYSSRTGKWLSEHFRLFGKRG